jgi:acetyltransferase-like isoleucine patch superfamily enzyme
MLIADILRKIRYNVKADRLGPDMPFSHWKLHFKSTMINTCRKKFAFFGNGAEFRPGAYAVGTSKIKIGNRVVVRPGSMLFGETVIPMDISIDIEDDVMMGSGVQIYVNNHRFDNPLIPLIDQGYYPDEKVVLKRGCWIGANAIILPGVVVGENAVVGAGSIVTKSVPSRVVVVGCPAKVIKEIS